jgi:cation diffusion facilitator family transporter
MSHSHHHSHIDKEKQRVASISLLASAGLSILKFVAALVTGSLGLLSEAVHSLVDFGATAITWFAVRWSGQPADDQHHFGHAKIESVAALFETILLLAISIFVAYEAIHRLFTGKSEVEVTWWAIAIIIISIVVDLNRSRALATAAKNTSSEALAADAAHFQSDMWTSVAVLLGLIGVWLGFQSADAIAALVVSVFIAAIGFTLGKSTLASLLDTAPEGVTADMRTIAENTDRILAVNLLRVKPAGSLFFVTLSVDVSRMLPTTDLLDIKENLTAAIRSKYPQADLTISINPVPLDNETAFEKIALVANLRNLSVHHLTVQNIEGKLAVSFDLEVEGSTTLERAHQQATELEDAVRNGLGGDVEVESHIEPLPLRQLTGQTADLKTSNAVEKILQQLTKTERLLSDLHNIRVRYTDGGLYVHYHCRFAPSQTIDAVHAVVDKIENALKARFPHIQRVVAHAEPIGHRRHKL